jgi:hypothetical protein
MDLIRSLSKQQKKKRKPPDIGMDSFADDTSVDEYGITQPRFTRPKTIAKNTIQNPQESKYQFTSSVEKKTPSSYLSFIPGFNQSPKKTPTTNDTALNTNPLIVKYNDVNMVVDKVENVVKKRQQFPTQIVEPPRINIHEFGSIFKRNGVLIDSNKIQFLFSNIKDENPVLLQHIIDELVLHNWWTVAIDLYSIAKAHQSTITLHSAYEALILSNNILHQTKDNESESQSDKPQSNFMEFGEADQQIEQNIEEEIQLLDTISDIILPAPNKMDNLQYMLDVLLRATDYALDESTPDTADLLKYAQNIRDLIQQLNTELLTEKQPSMEAENASSSAEDTSMEADENTSSNHNTENIISNIATGMTEWLNILNNLPINNISVQRYDTINTMGVVNEPEYKTNTYGTTGGYDGLPSKITNANQPTVITGGDSTRPVLAPYMNIDPYLHGQSMISLNAEAHHDIVETRTKTKPEATLKLADPTTFFNDDNGVKTFMNTAWKNVLDAQHDDVISAPDGSASQREFWKSLYTKMHDSKPKNEDEFVSRIFETMANNNMDLPVCNPCTIFKTSAINGFSGDNIDLLTPLLEEAKQIYTLQIAPFYDESNVILYLKIDGPSTSIYIYVFNKTDSLDFKKLVHTNDMNIDSRELLLIGGEWLTIIENILTSQMSVEHQSIDLSNHPYANHPYEFFIDDDNNNNIIPAKLISFTDALNEKVKEYTTYEFLNNAKVTDPANSSPGELTLYPPDKIGTDSTDNEYCIRQAENAIELFRKHLVLDKNNEYINQLIDVFDTYRINGGALSKDNIINDDNQFTEDVVQHMPELLLESFERKGYLTVINEVMSDWFTDDFFITTCKPIIILPDSNGIYKYNQIQFTTTIETTDNDHVKFMLEVNKSTVLNICVFMEKIHTVCSTDSRFLEKVLVVKNDKSKQNELIRFISQYDPVLVEHYNAALYSVLVMLLHSIHLLHDRFNDITVLQLMIIFIGFIKSIGDKKQIMICSALNKMFAESTGGVSDGKQIVPFKMYVASKDRNFAGQCCIYDALFAAIGNFMNSTTDSVRDDSPNRGGNYNTMKGGARTDAIKLSAPLVISQNLKNSCIEDPETEEAKMERINAREDANFNGVRSSIALKFDIQNKDDIKLYTQPTEPELDKKSIAEYNKLFWALQKYNSTITITEAGIQNDAELLLSAKIQQKINITFTRAQIEYIRKLTNRTIPADSRLLIRFIVSFLLAESQLVDILINIMNEASADLITEFTQYNITLLSIERKSTGTAVNNSTPQIIMVDEQIFQKLQTVIQYYNSIITSITDIHDTSIRNLLAGIATEQNALDRANQRSSRNISITFTDNKNEDLIEDLNSNLQEVESTLNILNQQTAVIKKVDYQVKKLDSIKNSIKQVEAFNDKLKEWFKELLEINIPDPISPGVQPVVKGIADIKGIAVDRPVEIKQKPAALLKQIKDAISKPLKIVSKTVGKTAEEKQNMKTKLSERIKKLADVVKPRTKTTEVLNGISERIRTTTTNFASRINNLFTTRTGGTNHVFQLKHINRSRKNHNKQNNKRSNRRIRKLGVLSKKRNSNIPKSKRNQRKTIHRKSPK